MSDFELRDALGEQEYARLVKAQRRVALDWFNIPVVERMTTWLVENGHEQAGEFIGRDR